MSFSVFQISRSGEYRLDEDRALLLALDEDRRALLLAGIVDMKS
jgi:hypothetical protein